MKEAERAVYALYAKAAERARARTSSHGGDRRLGRHRSCRRTPGRTWPPPTTARRCACTSTAPRSRRLRLRARCADVDRRAAHRRQQHLGRVLRRPDRRGPRLQPRAHAAEIQTDMNTPVGAAAAGGHDRRRGTGTLDRDDGVGRGDAAGRRRPTTSAWSATSSTARRTAGFTPSAANRIAQATRHLLRGHRPGAGDVLLPGLRRGRGRQRRAPSRRGAGGRP